jgi:undecaprenyl-diphosphatase
VFLSLVILAIGFSRIYLRVHYASDVLGGYVIGFAWLFVSLLFLNTLEKRSMHGKM